MASRLSRSLRFALVTDLDHTLVRHRNEETHEDLLAFNQIWQRHFSQDSLLVYSTGRSPARYLQLRETVPLLAPDVLVCSVGTEIFWRGEDGTFHPDAAWFSHLEAKWSRAQILDFMSTFHPTLFTLQEESEQRSHKVSYYIRDPTSSVDLASVIEDMRSGLGATGFSGRVIFSGGKDVDVLPDEAGKGKALAYLLNELRKRDAYPRDGIQVNGDSGNDIDLFQVDGVRGCIVANALPELVHWTERNGQSYTLFRVASRPCAGGIVEALEHYGTLESSPEHSLTAWLLKSIDKLVDHGDGDFLSEGFTLRIAHEEVETGKDAVQLKSLLQIDAGSVVFTDDVRGDQRQLRFLLCQIRAISGGWRRSTTPVELTLQTDDRNRRMWKKLSTGPLDVDSSYGTFC